MLFSSHDAIIAHIQELPGYTPPLQAIGDSIVEDYGGVRHLCSIVSYNQLLPDGYKIRKGIVQQCWTIGVDGQGNETLSILPWQFNPEYIAETPEGIHKIVQSIAGPDLYYTWSESMAFELPWNGAGLTALKNDLTTAGDGDTVSYYLGTNRHIISAVSGFQQVVASWDAASRGDFINVFIEAPDGHGGWAVLGQFAAGVKLHGDNPVGVAYPPTPLPNVSWLQPGMAIRVDYYAKTPRDTWLLDAKAGIWFDLDLVMQRIRPQ